MHKPTVDVHSAPDFKSPTVATLKRDAKVQVAGQQGLWFQVSTQEGKSGFVRVNDVRMEYAGTANGNAGALFTGKAGKGRVSETAGVRGIDHRFHDRGGHTTVPPGFATGGACRHHIGEKETRPKRQQQCYCNPLNRVRRDRGCLVIG